MQLLQSGFYNKPIWIIAMLASLFLIMFFLGCEPGTPQDKAESDDFPIHKEAVISFEPKEPKQIEDDCEQALENTEAEQDGIWQEEELLKHKPNELGQVMILMYHHIGETESEWVRTPQNFKKDLVSLYENGYRLVNLLDYLRKDMDIEAGKSPVVITFDDGGYGQLDFIEVDQGFALDPNCAVAILEDFLKDYPDFGRGAAFYIYYPNPFGQEQHIREKFEFLAEMGYEIGNHTYSHANLSLLSDEDALMEIALNAKKTNEILPGYKVRSLALPYGQYPQNRDILAEGNYKGYHYKNHAVLLVGSNPAPSPFSIDFEPLAVPRIRASEVMVENSGIYDWLGYFKNYPERRYISDGDPGTVTAPKALEEKLDRESASDKKIYFY